ncbi:MAG TPA: hypothetical protein VMZ73_10050 [Acidimicrobiales bacterium]|nr:hypothetical protein [Acidimicrobiales bacterium]
MPGRTAGRHQALYRALVTLYPRSFREGYGEPMVQLFADRVRDVGAKAWLRALPDLLRTVPVQRIEAVMSRLGPGARVLALAFAVLGATAVSIGVGAGAAPIMAVAVVALLVSQRRLFASLAGERAPLRHAVVQAWWAPVAGLLGLAMILAGVGTVFEAHNIGGRIFGSSLLLAFGGAMLFGLMRRPFARPPANALILLATVPALAMFWMIVPLVAAIAIWAGVLAGGFEEPAVV